MATPSRLAITPDVSLPRSAIRFSFSRSGGPGGQNVNKVSSRVQLRVSLEAIAAVIGEDATRRLRGAARVTDAGELLIESDRSRSQVTNRRDCLERLGVLLTDAMKTPRSRRATKPSRAARERRLDAKTHRARVKRLRGRPHNE